MSDPNLFSLDLTPDKDDAPGYRVSYTRVGPIVGASELGLSVYELQPGNSICPYHYEIGMEEWLIVLVGRPTLRTPDGEQVLRPWDAAFFPGNESGAHKVTNATGETVRVAMLSTTDDPNVAVYPDSEKVGAWPPGKLFRLGSAVPYFDGEA